MDSKIAKGLYLYQNPILPERPGGYFLNIYSIPKARPLIVFGYNSRPKYLSIVIGVPMLLFIRCSGGIYEDCQGWADIDRIVDSCPGNYVYRFSDDDLNLNIK